MYLEITGKSAPKYPKRIMARFVLLLTQLVEKAPDPVLSHMY